jgi:hypothetical protein
VIVAAGGLLGCVAIGAMFSLPVFLLPISTDTGWSVTGVSTAMTVGFIAMAPASMAWGALSDRIGPRLVVLIGSVILVASLALASRVSSLIEFQLVFGLLVGGATAAILAPMMACVTGWFDTHRSRLARVRRLRMAPMTMAPLAVVVNPRRRTSLDRAALARPCPGGVPRPPAATPGRREGAIGRGAGRELRPRCPSGWPCSLRSSSSSSSPTSSAPPLRPDLPHRSTP